MSVRQLIVLGVALLAAVGALFFIQSMRKPTVVQAAVPAATAGPRAVVAANQTRVGHLVQQADLVWKVFPADSVQPTYFAEATDPTALETLVGAVTRREYLPGEPLTQASLVRKGEAGFLAAQLPPGYRAVAVPIKPVTAAGGFIQPGDRVDVVLTNLEQVGTGQQASSQVRSRVIMENVKVLAIGTTSRSVEAAAPQVVPDATMATLELSTADATALLRADEAGDLSLVLRGVEVEPPKFEAPSARVVEPPAPAPKASGPIRFHSFGVAAEASQGASQ